MILRLLTKHVKDQSWVAVVLDFVIVVVGVAVALKSIMLRARGHLLARSLLTWCATVKSPKTDILIIEYNANLFWGSVQ
ncbi:MAG: hypothetical protein ACI9LU_000222 [Polaribacter sp.]|jgi:hypothetical protein